MRTAFCDSSALVKLVVAEPESAALSRGLRAYSRLAASALSIVEVSRAVRRHDPSLEARAHRLLQSLNLVALDTNVLKRAALLNPSDLRSLDAVQLASALSVPELELDFVAYDKRVLRAAAQAGLRTLSPG